MRFVHEDPDFGDLLRIVATRRGASPGLIEKDYWVTHVLWAIHDIGFEVWLKGGTSLSKGFALIERFSEDLDLKIEAGTVASLPHVSNWKSQGSKASGTRRSYFARLARLIEVPGATTSLGLPPQDPTWRSAGFDVSYPGRYLADLSDVLRPTVLLEVGNARVDPFVERSMSSFVHDFVVERNQLGGFRENRPNRVRCVHPIVTLIENLDAIRKRVPNEHRPPATYVRHFEDVARIIAAEATLPALQPELDARELVQSMAAEHQIADLLTANDPAFQPTDSERWNAIRTAHSRIAPMFWGGRIPIESACESIRAWISRRLGDERT